MSEFSTGLLFGQPVPVQLAEMDALFDTFDEETAAAVQAALSTALAGGMNPLTVAPFLVDAMSPGRAETIARTEMLGAYRDFAGAMYRANSNVVQKWMWSATGAGNTCAACLFMDGQTFDLDESMSSHVNCRCASLPVTLPWEDILGPLGIDASDIGETDILQGYQTGMDWFLNQADAVQRDILGPSKYEAWQQMDLNLGDLVGHDANGAVYERSLSDLGLDFRDYLGKNALHPVEDEVSRWPEGVSELARTDDGMVLLKTPLGNVWTYEDATGEELQATLDTLDPARGAQWSGVDQTAAELRGETMGDEAFSVSRAAGGRDITATYDLTADDQAFAAALKDQIAALDQSELTYQDMIDVGRQLNTRIDADLADLRAYAQEASHIRDVAPNLTDAERAWAMGQPDAMAAHGGVSWVEATARYQAEYQARVLAYLQEIRDMGGVDIRLADAAEANGRVADLLRAVQDRIPQSWLEASNGLGEILPLRAPYGANLGGAFRGGSLGNGQLKILFSRDANAINLESTALHEMMHRMEQVFPQLSDLEAAFYNARTAGEDWTAMTNGMNLRTKLDQWRDQYLGAEPLGMFRPGFTLPDGRTLYATNAFELLSVGAEAILGGGYAYDLILLRQDEEYISFVLGIFAALDG